MPISHLNFDVSDELQYLRVAFNLHFLLLTYIVCFSICAFYEFPDFIFLVYVLIF